MTGPQACFHEAQTSPAMLGHLVPVAEGARAAVGVRMPADGIQAIKSFL